MEKEKGYNLSIKINNLEVSYNDVGEGTIPIIFIHGFPFDKTMWQRQMYFLKSSNRVIAYDLKGFGESKEQIASLTIEMFTEDLIAFMNALHIDKAILCGLSMGGYIVLNAVKKYPERFEALILSDTQCIADTAEAKEKRYKAIDEINENGVHAFNEKFIKSIFHTDSLIKKKEVIETLRINMQSNTRRSMTRVLAALAERTETCSEIHNIQIPTLIICGREDAVTPLSQSESMHEAIKGSMLRVIDNAGHVSNLEQPHTFNKHLQEFLSPFSISTSN
ncbi:alpha/beta fold hydrolase [Cytophaga hutchinsonii]|uniref:Hydrolase, alpha/beta fold family n=1 Tax=Cytophaga hutchinsonii (strain ATCC 33406 / DSM 1761 / CIP 103989 / NBRC 15051 / NCIMB 9469 / D465) TaxID=269798 RepID=A0A6N4ST12_CYTH3|nr:alpha/beta hydrolase [Cytophaga hutchinsonii]ABG59568.1 hydrolase, alpha/beta fold family [Cytophaga hutchinsonii ATCC 33406]SFY03400.1 Pimeloyl-ACP methyl ester carboxylesterase [Cytophaga hutchinsonii ATCC 33406]